MINCPLVKAQFYLFIKVQRTVQPIKSTIIKQMLTIPQQKQRQQNRDSRELQFTRANARNTNKNPTGFNHAYTKLNQFIEAINQKINGRIQLVQQVYLDDYKKQVTIMSQELKKIRAVMDQEIIKQKSNERLFFLQEERDFFRAQVLKLNGDVEKALAENNKLKVQLHEKTQELENYRKITYGLETKIFKLKNESIEAQKTKDLQFKQTTLNKKNSDFQLPTTDRYHREQDLQKTKPRMNFGRSSKITPSKSMKTYSKFNMFNEEVSERQQIIDNCINQIKKQVYYRNLNLNQSNKVQFDQTNKVHFSKLTKTDKRELVFKLISNPKILEDFYDFLFDKRSSVHEKPQRLTKLTDSKFNTKTLLNIKAEFNKKIYDLKLNS